jgi:Kazal-type serine protease inhibitor-like protein
MLLQHEEREENMIHRHFAAPILALLLAALPAAGSTLITGDPFRIGAPPGCFEQQPEVAPLPGGGAVVVWQEPTEFGGPARLVGHRFDRDGNPLGDQFAVQSSAFGPLSRPAVAADAAGRFMVVWRDEILKFLLARQFDAAGRPLGDEFRVVDLPFAESHAVAATPDGGFVVAWASTSAIWVVRYDAQGRPLDDLAEGGTQIAGYVPIPGLERTITDPAVAVAPSGKIVVVWRGRGGLQPAAIDGRLVAFVPGGAAGEGPALTSLYLPTPNNPTRPAVAIGADGGFLVAWREELFASGPPAGIAAQRFDAAGQQLGDRLRLDEGTWSWLGGLAIATDVRGDYAVVWDGKPAGSPAANSIYARFFSPAGAALGPTAVLAAGGSPDDHLSPAVARDDQGRLTAVWQEGLPPVVSLPVCTSGGITARRFALDCLADSSRLCLNGGRFQVDVAWSAQGGAGAGRPVGLTGDTGYFWFFDPANVELVVKVLDGRALNGHFWVFYGSLSDIAFTLTVTDTATGARKVYRNPPSTLASRGDTDAFPAAGSAAADAVTFVPAAIDREAFAAAAPAGAPTLPAALSAAATAADSAAGPCTDPALPVVPRPGLCLNARRFEVEATWHDPFNGGSGVGQGVQLTGDSGYFWFFAPANVELAVKVLDGRAVNGRFWVFYGALTNVEYTLKVHHFSGAEKSYHNPPFQFASRADTAAFAPPAHCSCPPTFAAVCGFDGNTYESPCDAECRGFVQVAHPGPC